MELSEIRERKAALEKKISDALHEFEEETTIRISSIGFVRRAKYKVEDENSVEDGYTYAVETRIEL